MPFKEEYINIRVGMKEALAWPLSRHVALGD